MYSEQMHYVLCKLKDYANELGRVPMRHEFQAQLPRVNFDVLFKSYDNMIKAAGLLKEDPPRPVFRDPKILVLDIETKPMKVWSWGIWDQNIALDMIIEDWSVLSWAAKWVGSEEVIYQDLSGNSDYTDDKIIIKGIWELLNQADVIVTQNGARFDEKKLNTKFEEHGFGPPTPFKHIDTLKIKKKYLALTSNKLEFSTGKFNEKYTKLKHKKFPGMSLWLECLKGNQEAWAEMKEYNIHDVLSLEELYMRLKKWDKTINYGVYTGEKFSCPTCGNVDLEERESSFNFTKTGKFQNYFCKACGSHSSGKDNLLDKNLRKAFLK